MIRCNLFLKWFDLFSLVVFTVGLLMRIYVSDLTHPSSNKLKSALLFLFSWNGLVDLSAIMPFYLPALVKVDLKFLRLLRIIRILRILKLTRYTNSLTLILEVVKDKKLELSVTWYMSVLLLVFIFFVMYFVEGPVQPEAF